MPGGPPSLHPSEMSRQKRGGDAERLVARIDMDELVQFRQYITCFADRLPGTYGLF